MKPFLRSLALIFALAAFALADDEQTSFELFADSLSGKPAKMDFSKNLSGINDPGLLFSHFSQKPLLIYYFSPKCAHCQRHFPTFQQIAKEFEAAGVSSVGISLGGYIKKNDVRTFIDQIGVTIPVFQDSDRQFGNAYGTGYVPVMFLVLPDGTFYRYESAKDESFNHIRTTLSKLTAK